MNREEYYANKIAYAISKIEYAQAKLNNTKSDASLTRLYLALQGYDAVKMSTLMLLTKMSRDAIVPKLRRLKEIGVIDWKGAYLRDDKEVYPLKGVKELADKPEFAKWLADLRERMKASGVELKTSELMLPENRPVAQTTQNDKKPLEHQEDVTVAIADGLSITISKSRLRALLVEHLR